MSQQHPQALVAEPDPSSVSMTQRLAGVSARHPWRMLVAWGFILLASFVAIGTLLGSALTTDANITTRPDSVVASDRLADSFPQSHTVDEIVIVHSSDLTASDPDF
ncbi:MAG: hypothetical protein ACJ72Y_01900, partial [Actinomycetes bacterium]